MIAALVIVRGNSAEVLESVGGTLDDVAALVGLRIERWRATAFAAAAMMMRLGFRRSGQMQRMPRR